MRLADFKPAAAAPTWSYARRLGLGMVLAAPLLATGSLYLRSLAASEANASVTCGNVCAARDANEMGRARQQATLAQVLLGAGIATIAGGGLLLWLERPRSKDDSVARAALRFGPDGRPSAVLVGKF